MNSKQISEYIADEIAKYSEEVFARRNSVCIKIESGYVKNVEGTAKDKSPEGSWLEHWKKYTSEHPDGCSICDCRKLAAVGAHVTEVNEKGEKLGPVLIIPLCENHNQEHEIMRVPKGLIGVAVEPPRELG